MKKLLIFLLLPCLLAGCAFSENDAEISEGYTFTDSAGDSVTVPYKPQKVAVLTSSLADLWITAGGSVDVTVYETVERGFVTENVVLVDDGAGKTVNTELLVASKPDFVLYSTELSGQIACAETLKNAGIAVAGFDVSTFDDYLNLLKICTDIMQTPDKYEEYGTKLQNEINDIITRAKGEEHTPNILFVRAGSSAKYTKAKTKENHFVCVMLDDIGTYNIAEKATVLLDGLSIEEILISDPDAILFTTMGDEESGRAYMESLVNDPLWQKLSAVKNNKVYQLPKELFQYKPNLRWKEAYSYLIGLLYGDII